MFEPSVAALFPLPLTTFERYMLWDDRPDYPMVSILVLRLRGQLQREAFEASLDDALSQHPLLCALVDRSNRRRPAWVLVDGLKPTVDWHDQGVSVNRALGERIDLEREAGLRVSVRLREDAAEVTMQFHHVSSDGIGAMRFVGHLLAAYAARTALTAERPTVPSWDPAGLVRRGQYAAQSQTAEGGLGKILSSVRDGIRWILRRPAILGSQGRDIAVDAARSTFLETQRHVFSEAETTSFREAAKRLGVTVNDLLLRDMFLTLARWRAEEKTPSAGNWLRIAVPVNLRSDDADRTSAANGISYTFLTRHGGQCADAGELLRGIRQEMNVESRRRRALLFLRGFETAERIPGAMWLQTREDRCFATVVLSNLADLSRLFGVTFPRESDRLIVGNLVLDDIFGAAPIRANTRAAVSISTYNRRLSACLRCDPRFFCPEESERLLACYVDRIKRTMSEGDCSSTEVPTPMHLPRPADRPCNAETAQG